MRSATALLVLVLALAPLGLAQPQGSDPEDPPECRSADGRERCADDEPCEDGKECQSSNETESKRPAEWCQNGNRTAGQKERCRAAVQTIRDEQRREWVAFAVDPANATLLDYRVGGVLVLKSIDLDLDQGNLTIDPEGSTLRVRAGGDELRLHDEPNGLLRFKGDGNLTLVFPDARIVPNEHGARIQYAGGREGHLLADNATWLANDTVRLTGFFAFHVPPAVARDAAREVIQDVQVRKQDAIERRTLGAEITLKPRSQEMGIAASAQDIQVLAYDDVEVSVDLPDVVTQEAPLRVVVSSELSEGRTIVLNVDESLLDNADPSQLLLRYFDLNDDGSETEVYFFEADGGLQDILDPANDGGRPEYWIVQDANGVQVLVSVPHWSAHAITMASLSELDVPSVLVGISLGVALTVGLSVALLWPRRRTDDE